MSDSITDNVREICEQIARAAAGRIVQLIGVTKTVEPARIREAFAAGIRIFGENRIQEGVPKIKELEDLGAEWHFIGHLQTNKARDAVRYFTTIQSVDSQRLLREIEKEASKQQKRIRLLLELNLGGEETKHGLRRDELSVMMEAGRALQWCTIRGLMVIPPLFEDPERVRPYFRELRELRDRIREDHPDLIELSMGMSHDFGIAVEEGATMVRIGTAVFGERA